MNSFMEEPFVTIEICTRKLIKLLLQVIHNYGQYIGLFIHNNIFIWKKLQLS